MPVGNGRVWHRDLHGSAAGRRSALAGALLFAGVWLSPDSASTTAQTETVTLDLADRPGTGITRSVAPGALEVVALNRSLKFPYNYTVTRRTKAIAAFETAKPFPSGDAGVSGDCESATVKLEKDLNEADSEAKVRDLLAKGEERLRNAKCSAAEGQRTINRLRSQTTVVIPAEISQGEEVTITISRPVEGKEKEALTWTVRFETSPRGTWLMTYGFSIIPDRDERFWLRPGSTAGELVVERQVRGQNELKFLPALFFTWLSARDALHDYSWGPTVGLAAGKDTYGLFLGGAVLYNWNVQLSAGASVFLAERLNGKYHVGDTVKDNLTEDQLHRRVGWPGWYVALTFRFGENPFRQQAESEVKER